MDDIAREFGMSKKHFIYLQEHAIFIYSLDHLKTHLSPDANATFINKAASDIRVAKQVYVFHPKHLENIG